MRVDPCTASAPTLCGTPAAGEGSYGQLVRRFGAAGAERVVSNLGAVWISHIHADHHAGLPRLLAVSHRPGMGASASGLARPGCTTQHRARQPTDEAVGQYQSAL